ncbi:hypothetical protein P615_07805 [Brevibacillus laterosporus PE36]|nr:hypothetical protein P615_07805 [Brevibacillus laterosporus PE36]
MVLDAIGWELLHRQCSDKARDWSFNLGKAVGIELGGLIYYGVHVLLRHLPSALKALKTSPKTRKQHGF